MNIYICGEYPLYKGILSQNQFSSRGFSPLALARNSYEYPRSVNFAGTVKIVYGVDQPVNEMLSLYYLGRGGEIGFRMSNPRPTPW